MIETLKQKFMSDITTEQAYAAHRNTSEVPEVRARSEREGYASTLAQDYADLSEHVDSEEKQEILDTEFERYRSGYQKRYSDYLRTRAGIVSILICGPANFPTRRNQKRNEISSRRLNDLVEYRQNALKAIKRKLHPELAPIMAGDSDAVERLTKKIQQAEANQQLMKDANKAIRNHEKSGKEAQLNALLDLGLDEGQARKVLTPNYMGNIGFESWQLSNNNANIRRMKERLEQISKAKTATVEEKTSETGIRLEDNPADNRVRLFFPGKPSAEVRSELKSNGFRWAPSIGAWQAYRNHHSLMLAQRMVSQ